MRRHWRFLTAVLCLLAVAAACRRGPKPRERGELTAAEKAVVAAFTSGTISRESPIRVAFHEAVARPDQVGAPLDASPFRFEPRIKGTTVWAAPDRIEFRPAERLPDGQTYAASLDLGPVFPAGKAPFARFDFVFSTMRQSFDVAVEGLQSADATDVKRQSLTGRLVTADVEDAPGVEKVLRASHNGARPADLLGPRDEPPRPRLHRRRDRAGGAGLGPAPALGRRPHRGRPEGGPRDRRARPRHVHRRPGARRRRPGAARRAALHRPPEAGPEPEGPRPDRRPRRPALRDRRQPSRGLRHEGLARRADGPRRGGRPQRPRVPHEGGPRAHRAVRAPEAGGALRGQGCRPADLGRLHRSDRGGEPPGGDRGGDAHPLVQHAAVPAGEPARRRAGAPARGPRRVDEDALPRPDAGQGEPLAAGGPRRPAAPREEPGGDVPAHPVVPAPARRVAVRGRRRGGGARAPGPGRRRAAGAELLGQLGRERGGRLGPALREPRQPLPPRVLPALLRPRHPRRAQRPRVRPRPHGQGRRGRLRDRLRHRPPDHRPRRGRRGDAPRLPAADARHRPHRPRRHRASPGGAAGVPRHGAPRRPDRLPAPRRRLRPPGRPLRRGRHPVAEGPQGLPLRRARDLAPRRRHAPHVHPPRPREEDRGRPPGALRPRGPARPARADGEPHAVDGRLLRVRRGHRARRPHRQLHGPRERGRGDLRQDAQGRDGHAQPPQDRDGVRDRPAPRGTAASAAS